MISQACQFYVGSFWLLPVQFNALLPPPTLNPSQVTNLIKQISLTTGAEVVFKSMCFELHGLEHEVRAAVGMIMELDIIKVNPSRCTYHICSFRYQRLFRPSTTKYDSR